MPMNIICTLQGQRGTGKSSLLEVLAGLQMPQWVNTKSIMSLFLKCHLMNFTL